QDRRPPREVAHAPRGLSAGAGEIATPPREDVVTSHRKSGADDVGRHRRPHDAETDDAHLIGYGHVPSSTRQLPSAPTAVNSASIDSRGMLRTMKTIRERGSVSRPSSSVTGE